MTRRLAGAALAVVLLAGCSATANAPTSVTRQARPAATQAPLIGRLNPAVTQATIHSTICVKGWTATVRPPLSYTSRLKRRELPAGARMADYEMDHLMPLELGGAPRDVANLRPVPIKRAQADDVWETRLRKSVCAGSMTLAAARVRMSEIKKGEDR
jgi:hypothetical protein